MPRPGQARHLHLRAETDTTACSNAHFKGVCGPRQQGETAISDKMSIAGRLLSVGLMVVMLLLFVSSRAVAPIAET